MKDHSYFTFSLHNRLYGIDASCVEEVFSLPELASSPKAAHDIIGIVNLRGEALPVMDLNLSFGYQSSDYHLTDSVIVLKWDDLRIGIIVNEVHGLRNIDIEEIITNFYGKQELVIIEQQEIIIGIVESARNLLILLSSENLFRYIETQQIGSIANFLTKKNNFEADGLQLNSSDLLLTQQPIFFSNATLEEKAIFRQRADDLKIPLESQDLNGLKTLAVIALSDHLFGIDLNLVREFTDIRRITPIPCCPAHIVGNMNLRGEILTLIDIRSLLHLPLIGLTENHKVMVVDVADIVTGIIVEEVYNVTFFLNPLEIMEAPATNDEYLQGVTRYHEKMMSILDLSKILLNGGLSVEEAS